MKLPIKGWRGTFDWLCCFFGYPCSPPVGHSSAVAKSNYNLSMKPIPGIGYDLDLR
jgi:hypothetical protein